MVYKVGSVGFIGHNPGAFTVSGSNACTEKFKVPDFQGASQKGHKFLKRSNRSFRTQHSEAHDVLK